MRLFILYTGLIVLLLVASAFHSSASAATDYRCVNRCTTAGYNQGYCVNQCTYQQPQPVNPYGSSNPFGGGNPFDVQPRPAPKTKQVDLQCQRQCLNAGYMLNLCNQKCGY